MICYALIARTVDGMALTVTTDLHYATNGDVEVTRRYVKLVAKKSLQFPDRCSLNLGAFYIHFITADGLSFVALCESSYPTVLAFSFLSDLQKEFNRNYQKTRVSQALRPYSFMEFDNFMDVTRKRYNKPQSLTTRINLSELSTEIKLRPPHIIQLSQVEPVINGSQAMNLTSLSVGPPSKLEPLPWHSIVVIILSVGLSAIGLYRGISSLGMSSMEEYYGPSPTHGFVFIFESLLRFTQIYLLLKHSRYHYPKSWIALSAACLCSFLLLSLRDNWQVLLYAGTAIGIHLCTIFRRFEVKCPNYNV